MPGSSSRNEHLLNRFKAGGFEGEPSGKDAVQFNLSNIDHKEIKIRLRHLTLKSNGRMIPPK